MKKQVFIINGSAGHGKDTFVEMVRNYFYKPLITVENYSSVSKIKEIAKIIGWNGEKTERDRKLLSDLKMLTTEYNDMPLNDMKKFSHDFLEDINTINVARILFLHIREPEEIARAVKEFEKYNAKTVLVKRDSVQHIISNIADENVFNYNYDIVINNNGTLEELKEKADMFSKDFLKANFKNEY